jgi:hypothetical protein
VIAAQDGDTLGEAHLERDQQRHCLNTVVAAVHIVTLVVQWCVHETETDRETETERDKERERESE